VVRRAGSGSARRRSVRIVTADVHFTRLEAETALKEMYVGCSIRFVENTATETGNGPYETVGTTVQLS
jgi:hypothetical protein